jgi:hypothetical protein
VLFENSEEFTPVVTNHAMLMDDGDDRWEFHHCDLEKQIKSKTWVLCHVFLLDVPMITILR